MVTEDRGVFKTKTYYGNSDDLKPTDGVTNGSGFIEMDTSKIYLYDAEEEEWLEWGAE